VVFDTNFLICYAGQRKSLPRSRAVAFIKIHADAPLYVSRVSAMEFAAGCPDDATAARHLDPFTILPVDEAIWEGATETFRALRQAGVRIGVADTLIAATARRYGMPVVTNNTDDFAAVKGIKALSF
jgi:predicted nucleic acid-binding protein